MPDHRSSRTSCGRESLTKEALAELAHLSASDRRPLPTSRHPSHQERLATVSQPRLGPNTPPCRSPIPSQTFPEYPSQRPSQASLPLTDEMTTPQPYPEEVQQLLQPEEPPRPRGRRHRRHEKDTYQSYPAIVNQSFEFQPPPSTPLTALPVARRPRVEPARREGLASRPPSIVATVGSDSRPTSTVSSVMPSAAGPLPDSSSQAPTRLAVLPAMPPIPPTEPAENVVPPVVMVYPVREPERPSTKTVKIVEPSRPAKGVSHAIVDEYEDDIACPICMNVMVGPCLLSPCGHALCGPCIVSWLETRASTGEQINCPVCRERVSKRHPLVQSRTLEGMIKRWVEHKTAAGEWDGHDDWKERSETWRIHKQFNPDLVSPELFSRRAAQERDSGQYILMEPDTGRLERILAPPTAGLIGSLPFERSSLLDTFFPDHRTSYFESTGHYGAHSFDPFQHLGEMAGRFEAIRNSILQDMARSRH